LVLKRKKERSGFGFKDSRSKSNFNYMQEKNDFSAASIKYALDNNAFQTDYIDLYSHWPEHKTNYFGQRGFKVQDDAWEDNIHAVLDTLGDFIKQGRSSIWDFLTKRLGDSCVF
jgi:aryl-alcohol dehydrogenase-like predicted oxidoreductase